MTCKYIQFLTLLLLPFLTGCVYENLDDCVSDITLTYQYSHHSYGGNRFEDEVDHMHVYIYDHNGSLVETRNLGKDMMTNRNAISFTLFSGKYTIVSWGNIHSDNFTDQNHTDINNLTVNLTALDENGTLTTTEAGSLFHGINIIDIPPATTLRETVSLTKNSNYIHVKIGGIDNITQAEIITTITGKNTSYAHDNTFSSNSREATYIPNTEHEGNYVKETFQTYRLMENDQDLTLRIVTDAVSPEGIVYSFNKSLISILLEKIAENQQEYLDKNDEYFLSINFKDDGSASVSIVESWEDVNNETEL